MQHAFFMTSRCVSRTVCIIYLALSSAALLGFGGQGGFSSHKVFTGHLARLEYSRVFFCFAMCIVQHPGLSAGSILDGLGVGVSFAHTLDWWSLSSIPSFNSAPTDWGAALVKRLLSASVSSWCPSHPFGKNHRGSVHILTVSTFPNGIRSFPEDFQCLVGPMASVPLFR